MILTRIFSEIDFSDVLDRSDLPFSVYIGALDIQYSHFAPYLWTFKLDGVDWIAYGRTWEDLRTFFRTLSQKMHLWINVSIDPKTQLESYKGHILKVIVPDLPEFFQSAKSELDFCPLPFVSKSQCDVLLATLQYGIQFHSYKAYCESDVDDDMLKNEGIVSQVVDHEKLSDCCKLTDDELDYSASRVYYISAFFRNEINFSYQGNTGSLCLTKTAKISRLISAAERKCTNRSNSNVFAQIKNMNPINSQKGREYILLYLRKAFSGGVTFYEENTINKPFYDVYCADFSSAYIARMVLSRYPMSKFDNLDPPRHWKQLLGDEYKNTAYLVTFEIDEIELKLGGFPFLSANGRFQYKDFNSVEEAKAHFEGEVLTSSTRIKKAKFFRSTLTDIDFKLFCENYSFDEKKLRLLDLVGARYGWLPDYLISIIVQLYSAKAAAKDIKQALEAAGELTLKDLADYERAKSSPARLYGIFTQSPVVTRYAFDPDTLATKIIDPHYISERQKFKPVIYQWGVWTTALVRKEIADLRAALLRAPEDRQIKVISGDTDCVNFSGEATDIIARYNRKVKRLIEFRAKTIGIDPQLLRDLGSLTVKKYKQYKITGLKQYCYIEETDKGDKFGFKVGGMNPDCNYFDRNFSDPYLKFDHFSVNLVIPREYEPRHLRAYFNEPETYSWKDRDGNKIKRTVKTHCEKIVERFIIHNVMSADGMSNKPAKLGKHATKADLLQLADQITGFQIEPMNYFKLKGE